MFSEVTIHPTKDWRLLDLVVSILHPQSKIENWLHLAWGQASSRIHYFCCGLCLHPRARWREKPIIQIFKSKKYFGFNYLVESVWKPELFAHIFIFAWYKQSDFVFRPFQLIVIQAHVKRGSFMFHWERRAEIRDVVFRSLPTLKKDANRASQPQLCRRIT